MVAGRWHMERVAGGGGRHLPFLPGTPSGQAVAGRWQAVRWAVEWQQALRSRPDLLPCPRKGCRRASAAHSGSSLPSGESSAGRR